MSSFGLQSLRSRITILVTVLFLVACSQEDPTAPSVKTEHPKLLAGQVKVAKESLQHLEIQSLSSTGDAPVIWAPAQVAIRDDRIADVVAPVAGRISAVHARVGDSVKAGAPLATMTSSDAARIRVEHRNAQVELSVADAELKRQRTMIEKGIGIESERMLAEAKFKQAQYEVERASRAASLLGSAGSDTILLRAPRDGVVIFRNANIGAAADPDKELLFKVGDPAALWVVADVFEIDLAAIKQGAPVEIKVPAVTQPLLGSVQRVGASLNLETRRASVFISLAKSGAELRPGMLASAGIQIERPKGLIVPMTAVLIKDGQRSIVYVQREETVFEARDVTLGQPVSGAIPVLSGLEPGERVVVKGALLLDGAASQLL